MITEAGARHIAELQDRCEQKRAEAETERLETDIAEQLAPGAIIWSKTKIRDGRPLGGVVVTLEYDHDHPDSLVVEAAVIVDFINDDVTAEPCPNCGGVDRRKIRSNVRRIYVDDIGELSPRSATGMHGNAKRLLRACCDRPVDKNWFAYHKWAERLALEAGEVT